MGGESIKPIRKKNTCLLLMTTYDETYFNMWDLFKDQKDSFP